MPFITPLPDDAIDENVRAMYARQEAHWGFVPNYAKVFCYRPEVMGLWAALQAGIKRHMERRRFELVTFAAAQALRSTCCSLAHGRALTTFFSDEDVLKIARHEHTDSLSPAEVEMMRFARQVAHDAPNVSASDVDRLLAHGFSHAEIFDIAATAAARAFWTKLIESLGVAAEPSLLAMDDELKTALVVGRPIGFDS